VRVGVSDFVSLISDSKGRTGIQSLRLLDPKPNSGEVTVEWEKNPVNNQNFIMYMLQLVLVGLQ